MSLVSSIHISITIPEHPTEKDIIVLELASFLVKRFKGIVLRVERIDGWDGSNIRIIISDAEYMLSVLEAIEEFARERGLEGEILPEIVTKDEA